MQTLTSEDVKGLATDLGFDVCRVADARAPWLASDRLKAFIEAGHHGSMSWMADTLGRRQHPTKMWPDAVSAVVVGLNYGPEIDPLLSLQQKEHATISVYAQNRDYHDVLKKRLKRLARVFAEQTGEDVKVFVDTAPLMEKPLAERSGLGWQGKHTNLVSKDFGSWLFLGMMLTTAALSADPAADDHCGTCRACLDICPTNAFPSPYQLDARRCISYLTIEYDGLIPMEFRALMGNRIYGCDDCLAVCPWNKFAQQTDELAFVPRHDLTAPLLTDLVDLDDRTFRDMFSGSPVKRIKRGRFVRNVLIAIGNSGNRTLVPKVVDRLRDDEPQVRGMAVWALSQLDRKRFERERVAHLPVETDEDVRSEWQHD